MEQSSVFLILLIIHQLLHSSQLYVQLYNTEDSSSLEYYDCIHFKDDSNVKYCRRPGKVIELNRHTSVRCVPGGEEISYADLQRLNISAQEILQWSSSIEKADEYAAYLVDSLFYPAENAFLCNCSNSSVFGKFCEYELFFDSQSFYHTITTQFEIKSEDVYSSQIYGHILCYTTLECDYGVLCLDWRDICNGAQNCMNGIDEENCDLLEFNECEEDEYRCVNGQCVPEEYWMDGWIESSRECMDHTDESIFGPLSCLSVLLSFDCDERICGPSAWSCGDGECTASLQRFFFQSYYEDLRPCLSLRNCNYACEACGNLDLWTLQNGLCWHFAEHNISTEELKMTVTNDSCLLRLKCKLVGINKEDKCNCSLDEICQFDYDDDDEVEEQCSHLVEYPRKGLYLPYLSTYYTEYNFFFNDRIPSIYTTKGSVKCRGYQGIMLDETIVLVSEMMDNFEEFSDSLLNIAEHPGGFEYLFCNNEDIYQDRSVNVPKFDELCWSTITQTFNNKSYSFYNVCPNDPQCLSSYRINDGYDNCYHAADEDRVDYPDSCANIRKYRLQCSLNEEPTCLAPEFIGSTFPECLNNYDEFIFGSDIPVPGTACFRPYDDTCELLRSYIEMTTKNNTETAINSFIQAKEDTGYRRAIPYHQYCDSFWNLLTTMDESSEYCQQWICSKEQYQCPKTGQCIKPDWICDGMWDCSDGSDEEGIFIINNLSTHNEAIVNLNQRKRQCKKHYEFRPLYKLCDYRTEYPCLRNVSNLKENLWNFSLYKPCIPLSQLGDGTIHCYGGRDEKLTIKSMISGDVLGSAFLCEKSGMVILYQQICRRTLTCPDSEDMYGCLMDRVPNTALTDSSLCGYDPFDVFCLNGICKKSVRCDDEFDCKYGEDEYMCFMDNDATEISVFNEISYRYQKRSNEKYIDRTPTISDFPASLDSVVEHEGMIIKHMTYGNYFSQKSQVKSFNKFQIVFNCNRGVTIYDLRNNDLACFCPPSYYGEHCQYYSDRLTIVTHLNYTNSPYEDIDEDDSVVLQVLVSFLFDDEIIDQHNFRLRPADEVYRYIKHKFFLTYSRSEVYLNHKKKRYFNRTDILYNQPYSVRFEVYELLINQTIKFIGLWQFPIYFDYLPSFRLAKVLRFPINYAINDPCQSNPCNYYSICQRILNENSTSAYICLCKSPFYGNKCQFIDENCSKFCAPHSICKARYNGLLTSNQQPFCLCPLNYYGPRCYLKYTVCESQPCTNNGSCIEVTDPAEVKSYLCKCAEHFYGENCEHERVPVRIQIKLSSRTNLSPTAVLASIVESFDLEPSKLDLILKQQRVSVGLQLNWRYHHDANVVPAFAFFKVYDNNYRRTGPLLFLLYIQQNKTSVNVTVELNEINYCAHVSSLISKASNLNLDDTIPLIFKYHILCRDKLIHFSTKCFRDDDFLCICEEDHYRAQCFGYDYSFDRCDKCLSDGLCVQGFIENHIDFKCLCPRCHYGKLCQFSNELMSFTLDSLIVNDVAYSQKLASIGYITIATFACIVGFFNNLCSFVTFIRPKPRKLRVGNYLLIVSVVNQCSLIFLFLKIIHIVLYSSRTSFGDNDLNLYMCKTVSFLLSTFTRTNYWLTSLVTIDRLCMVLFVAFSRIKTPKVAVLIAMLVILVVAVMHIHEVLYYTTIVDPSYTSIKINICVTNYRETISTYNRINVLVHHFVPFIIQFLSITILIIQTTRSRVRTLERNNVNTFITTFKNKFQIYKEQYYIPTIIVVSSLPHAIFSFTYACNELKEGWKRYTLLTTYFVSYLPQILGFLLYVLPSKQYREEFRTSAIGKRLITQN